MANYLFATSNKKSLILRCLCNFSLGCTLKIKVFYDPIVRMMGGKTQVESDITKSTRSAQTVVCDLRGMPNFKLTKLVLNSNIL